MGTIVWSLPVRSVITMFVWSPVSAWIPHRSAGVVISDVQTASVKKVAQAETETDGVRIVVGIGRAIVAFRGLVDICRSAWHNGHPARWTAAYNMPGTVGLATSGTIALLLLAVDGDGGGKLPAGLSLVVNKGANRHHDTATASIWIHPVRPLVGFVVFQGVL